MLGCAELRKERSPSVERGWSNAGPPGGEDEGTETAGGLALQHTRPDA